MHLFDDQVYLHEKNRFIYNNNELFLLLYSNYYLYYLLLYQH